MLPSKIRTDPLWLVFAVLGGLVLLFIVAPLTSLCLQCSVPEIVDTVKDVEV